MEEETITNAPVDNGGQAINGIPVDDQGQAIPQPEETEQAEAVDNTTETNNNSEEAESEEADEPSEDEQLNKFAQAKGVTLDSENAKKIAKMAMNAEKAMHAKAAKASELEKVAKITEDQIPQDFTPQQVDNVRMRNLELKFEVQQWKLNNPDKLNLENDMAQIISDPTKRLLVQEGYLSLDDVYNMAQGSVAGNNASSLKSQGKQEALKSLAHKQQAAVPTGNAVNSSAMTSTITPENVDFLVAKNDQKWFESNYDKINKAMAGIR